MTLPYTDRFPMAAAAAAQSVAITLTAIVWHRPFRTRASNVLFVAAIWLAAMWSSLPELTALFKLNFDFKRTVVLQTSAMFATIALVLNGVRWLAVLAVVGQFALYALGEHLRESDFELAALALMWFGALLGAHALATEPRPSRSTQPADDTDAAADVEPERPRRSFARHDAVIFAATVVLAMIITNVVFGRLIYNGDEVANTFQAEVYGHLRAYAPIPPCPSMFDNYWVFRHQGRAFSQYTPGWPLFMAAFQRAGVIWMAGPVMSGILAVALARLSRRVASGLGPTRESSWRIQAVAGVLGPALAFMGPSLLLNGASRFSHTMVCACFAWSVESLCAMADRAAAGRPARGPGFLLGASIALGLATRPADGGMLAVGAFLYFVWALVRRRLSWSGLLFAAAGFVLFGGLTLVILRLQVGAWFKTAYSLVGGIHPEGLLRMSFPQSHQWKYGFPLATGSYMWWPLAPALGVAGLLWASRGRERRVPFMLTLSSLAHLAFYFMVEFGRGWDDGLGPRYALPVIVPMAAGGATILAPLVTTAWGRLVGTGGRFRSARPALLAAIAVVYGVARTAPLVYPIAYREYHAWTTPLRAAREMKLKNAIVILERGRIPADEWNLAQNPPMNPNPPVLFLIKRTPYDEACAREHFPGRTWYRAGVQAKLDPY